MTVLTLDGDEEIEIKAGTQPGALNTLRGKGMTRLRTGSRGDLQVHIDVEIPNKLSKEQAELLERFEQSRGDEKNTGRRVNQDESRGFFSKFKEAFRG